MRSMLTIRLGLLFTVMAVIGLIAVACGGGDDVEATSAPSGGSAAQATAATAPAPTKAPEPPNCISMEMSPGGHV